MKKTIYLDVSEIKSSVHKIIRDLHKDSWHPDYVVGITRGGLVPAVMLSHYLDVPMHTLHVSTRDSNSNESNLWMAEDAYGYVPYEGNEPPYNVTRVTTDPARRKNILIVDDINDNGRTLNFIKEDWPSGCIPADPAWNLVWHNNVRFAVLINNEASDFKDVDYVGTHINKLETPSWIVFSWEDWWER